MFCVFWSFSQNAGNQLCFRFWRTRHMALFTIHPLHWDILHKPLTPPLWRPFGIPSSVTPLLYPHPCDPSSLSPPLWPLFFIPYSVTPLLYPLPCDPCPVTPLLYPLLCDPSSLSPPLWPLFFIPSSVTPLLHTPWRDCWGPQWWLWLSWDSNQDSVSENRHNIISHLLSGLCHCTKIIYQYTLSQHYKLIHNGERTHACMHKLEPGDRL